MSTENNQTTANRLIKFKTLDNNITEMTVNPEILVKDLKVLIKDKLNIAPESQRLIVMGKQLNDNKKLSDYVNQDGQVIHLLARVADSSQPSSSQQEQSQQANSQQNPNPSSNQNRADPFNLNNLLGNYLNSPGMVQMTSLIFDQNGNNITNSSAGGSQTSNANLGNIDLTNILQNLGLNLNANSATTNTSTASNTTTSTNVNNNGNNNESNTQQQSQPANPYPILDDTNRHIGNMTNLINQMNGNLTNNEIPNVPSLNYPVNILTTFGTTLKNYHNNLQRLLPYINNLSDLLQRESLITIPQDRQNANRLAKNILTGVREITGANKMIETFLAGLEFGNRPAGGMVTYIQGSINQIQLVGEALDNMNNSNPISFNINLQNNPNNINIPTNNANLNSSNITTSNNVSTSIINNTNSNTTNNNAYPNLNQTNTTNANTSQDTSQNEKPNSNTNQTEQQQTNQNTTSNQTASRPAGGLNNLLGNLMGNLGNNSSAGSQASGRQANPLGNIGSLVNNIMSNPETSSMMNNMISSLSRPGGQNNLANMFGSLMGGLNAGNNQGGQPNLGNLLSSLMGNLGEDDVEEFEMNPEIKKLCENKNNWKKTKLSDLKNTLKMIKNPKYSELVDIILDLTIDEFYLLKRLQLEGFSRQAEKIREKLNNYMQKNKIDSAKLKQNLVDILNESFILVENDDHKIKTEGFDLEVYSAPFISDVIDYFLNNNLYELELNDKLNSRLIDFIGCVYNELRKVYSSEREGALFYFAENLRDFVEKSFGNDSIDNLLEINENIFEEMISNGVDIYDQKKKFENIKKKTLEQENNKDNVEPLEIKDMNHILSIADQDEKRFEKKNVNFSDGYTRTSLFKD